MSDKVRIAVEEAIQDIVNVEPELLTPLRRILKYEEECNGCSWTILDVIIRPSQLKKLIELGLVEKVDDMYYKLKDYKIVLEVMDRHGLLGGKKKTFSVTPKIFSDIVGYDVVKRIILMALRARAPVHVLLVGPPGVGKSLFLDAVREYMDKSGDCVGHVEGGRSLTTGVGLVELLLQFPPETPCLLIIDELDKMNKHDLAVLHRLMVTGEIVIAKHNKIIREKRMVWVLAAANDIKRIPEQIVSRFHTIRFRPLTEDEYKIVIPRILVNREGIDLDLAEYIAEKLAPYTRDPRDAIKLARMAYTKEDVDFLIETTVKRSINI